MKNRLGTLAALAASLLITDPAVAGKPSVGVAFHLEDARFKREFTAAEIADLQTVVARTTAAALTDRLGFASFSERPESADFWLDMSLEADPEFAGQQLKRTGLRLQLRGNDFLQRTLRWKFRAPERYAEPTGSVKAFAREIELNVQESDYGALVLEVLSQVPIAHEARLWKDPIGWVLPYRKVELCMDYRSVLRIDNTLPSGAGPTRKAFMARAVTDFAPAGNPDPDLGKLFSEALPSDELTQLRTMDFSKVGIDAVYVVEYRKLTTCAGPTPPKAVKF